MPSKVLYDHQRHRLSEAEWNKHEVVTVFCRVSAERLGQVDLHQYDIL